jgi:hypothetical protein
MPSESMNLAHVLRLEPTFIYLSCFLLRKEAVILWPPLLLKHLHDYLRGFHAQQIASEGTQAL